MRGFIRHTLDCSDIMERIEISHPGALVPPGDGEAWTEVPLPASAWTVVLDGEGNPMPEPYVRPPDVALALAKRWRTAEVNALLSARFAFGFPVSGTGTDMDGERLQVRNNEDRTNWLASESAYKDAVAAGMGAMTGALFRTAANNNFEMTFAQGLAVLGGMRAWAFALMSASWTLKDAVKAAADMTELAAIDIEAGWP